MSQNPGFSRSSQETVTGRQPETLRWLLLASPGLHYPPTMPKHSGRDLRGQTQAAACLAGAAALGMASELVNKPLGTSQGKRRCFRHCCMQLGIKRKGRMGCVCVIHAESHQALWGCARTPLGCTAKGACGEHPQQRQGKEGRCLVLLQPLPHCYCFFKTK